MSCSDSSHSSLSSSMSLTTFPCLPGIVPCIIMSQGSDTRALSVFLGVLTQKPTPYLIRFDFLFIPLVIQYFITVRFLKLSKLWICKLFDICLMWPVSSSGRHSNSIRSMNPKIHRVGPAYKPGFNPQNQNSVKP